MTPNPSAGVVPGGMVMALKWSAILALVPALAFPARAQVPSSEGETLSRSFRSAAKAVLPAVVTVRAVGAVLPLSPPVGYGTSDSLPAARNPDPDLGGSGVVVDATKGWILTNDHVVPDAPRWVVTLPDGRERPVKEVRRDPRSDLALVAIDPEGLSRAEWGDSEALDLGDWVLAVGQPFGLAGTVTAGIVSGARRSLEAGGYDDLIQTSAAINPGSSGGPLVDLQGRVVGINVAIKTRGGGYEGVGFAVPASRARRVASDLAEFGRVRRAFLGVGTDRLPPEMAAHLGLAGGARITSIVPRSPAETGGLLPGDLVVKVGDRTVTGPASVRTAVEFAPPDGPLAVTILRDGVKREITVKISPPPDAEEARSRGGTSREAR